MSAFDQRFEIVGPSALAATSGTKLATFDARDRTNGDMVLLTRLKPEFGDSQRDFEYGLRKMEGLSHPSLQPLLAIDIGPDGAAWATPRMPGGPRSLRRLLSEGAVFTERQAADIARTILEALQYVHERGTAFGNVKPGNVLVPPARDRGIFMGFPKAPLELGSIMQIGGWLGQPLSVAPEIIATGQFDARADVYGVGLLLFELAAGELPLETTNLNLGALFAELATKPWPRVSESNPDVNPKLEEVIAKAVVKDREQRYPTAAAMAAALSRLQTRHEPLLPRDRVRQLTRTAIPSPIAQVFASIEHQIDEVAALQRTVDTVQVILELLAAVVVASRIAAKVDPAIPDDAARGAFARPSLGHWAAVVREGARAGTTEVPELRDAFFDASGKRLGAVGALDALVSLRNEVRHGATLAIGAARRLVAQHRESFERMLAAALFLRDYDLVVPRSLNYDEGTFVVDAQVHRGLLPSRTELRLAQPVTVGRVYLVGRQAQSMLSLDPLIVSATCPVCDDEELFLYESAGADRIHYVSFAKGHALASAERLPVFERLGLLRR